MFRAGYLVMAVFGAACAVGQSNGEQEPLSEAASLAIQGPLSLQQGSTDRLKAVGVDPNVDGKVAWRSLPNRVIAVDPSGVVTAGALGTAVVVAEFGKQRAFHVMTVTGNSRPLRNQVDGTWAGEYRVTGCERLGGEGPSTCRSLLESRQPFRLAINQGGHTLEGRLELSGVAGQVAGSRDFTGKSLLEGVLMPTQAPEHPGPVGRAELTRWDVMFAVPQKRLKGTFEYLETFSNNWGYQVYLLSAEVSGVTKK